MKMKLNDNEEMHFTIVYVYDFFYKIFWLSTTMVFDSLALDPISYHENR